MDICIWITDSLCHTPETQHCKSAILQQKWKQTKQKTQTNKNNTYPVWFSFEEEKWIYSERSMLNTVGHLKRCCVMWSVAQSCLILCSPKDCSQPGSSIRGLFQARILDWVANSYSMESYRFMIKPTSLCLCVGR